MALNGQPQRADVVVVGDRAEPLLLAECKAPCIPCLLYTSVPTSVFEEFRAFARYLQENPDAKIRAWRGREHGVTPVSYTHLDVYKRQVVNPPKVNLWIVPS